MDVGELVQDEGVGVHYAVADLAVHEAAVPERQLEDAAFTDGQAVYEEGELFAEGGGTAREDLRTVGLGG